MAFEEIQSSGGDGAEREAVSAKIGVTLEGVFRGMSDRMPSQYGGEFRIVELDLVDGREVVTFASKILLERIEAAGLADGDKVKIVVESATTKDGKRQYALPRLFVDRVSPTKAAPAPAVRADDEPPF